MLKVIHSESENLTKKLQAEQNVVYSKQQNSFLLNSETYDLLDEKYHFENYFDDNIDEDQEDFDGFVYVFNFPEFLQDAFEGMEEIRIQMPYFTDSEDTAVIDMGEHSEMISDLYDEEYLPESAKESIQELMLSDDWYAHLLKDAKVFLLDVWIEEVKNTVEQMKRDLN